MTTATTFARLHDLRLSGMAQALTQQQEQSSTYEALPFLERLGLLVEQECLVRDQQPAQIARLAQGDWLQRAQNLLITGPCGSGKTFLACALGHNACLHGYTTRYYRLSRLLLAFTQAKADGSYHKLLAQTAKIRLLLIDDWGLEALTTAQRHDLMEIMDDRHGSASTVMVSQLPVDQWYVTVGDNTLADALLDRLIHNAHRLALKGESMRKKMVQLTEREHLS